MGELTVLGLGNVLMRDEGVGVRVMEAVRDGRAWPTCVEFVDGGAGGLNLLNVIEAARRLIVFDAADLRLPPGQCRTVSPEQIVDDGADGQLSLHEMPFIRSLRLCEQFSSAPEEVTILAIQPAAVEYGRQLSDELTAALPALAAKGAALVAAALPPESA